MSDTNKDHEKIKREMEWLRDARRERRAWKRYRDALRSSPYYVGGKAIRTEC